MSGLVKPKEYKVEDSNIAGLGSDLDKKIRQAAAGTEKAWEGAGKNLGIQIFRIEKFKVIPWPKERYGEFFDGDSYILLRTWKEKDAPKLKWDIHFWLGKYTTQDEAGTAAYKTVELDDLLGTEPVQHREVQGYESELFLLTSTTKSNCCLEELNQDSNTSNQPNINLVCCGSRERRRSELLKSI